MPDLWKDTPNLGGDRDEVGMWRGSLFRAKSDFTLSELYIKTSTPSLWDKATLYEIEENTGKAVSKIVEAIPLARDSQAYVKIKNVSVKKDKVYLIAFRISAPGGATYYYTEDGSPVENELYQAVLNLGDSTGDVNYGSLLEPMESENIITSIREIAVGLTIAKPEKYFEMGTSPTTQWSNAQYTVSNVIRAKQDMNLVAIDFFTMNLDSEPDVGIARVWDDNSNLLAKGVPSVNQTNGAWTRSTFTSPVLLEKDKAYYIGMTALNIGCSDKLGGIRDIVSNDGSLLIGSAIQNYATTGDTDTRPTTSAGAYEFSLRLQVEVNNTRFLIDSDGTIKKLSGLWTDIGFTPVTDQMFKDHGMLSLNDITAEQWKALPKNSKILVYSEEDKIFKASISRSNLYNSEEKLYRGTGIIETEMEELPAYRKTLMITADHQDCTFQYSLDNGTHWNTFQPGDMIDVSKKSGKQLKIQINLPTDLATLSAISYAWA